MVLKMCVNWLYVFSLAATAAAAGPISEELFHRAPRLFHLDDFDRCLFQNGTYCMGVFQISPAEGGEDLYRELLEVSENGARNNRSLVHRGLCVSWCDVDEQDPASKMEKCLDKNLQENYHLRARLMTLNYCKSKQNTGTRPLDFTDYLVVAALIVILALNVIGSVYDQVRNPKDKPIKLLLAWSLQKNWAKLTTVFSGDQKVVDLSPIHGIKAHMILLVIFSHTTFAVTMVYLHDERYYDELGSSLVGTLMMNGPLVVQTFNTISGFLIGNVILTNFNKAKKTPSIYYWPHIVLNRFMRMAPALLFTVGCSATWTARLTQGPMWHLMEEIEAACRKKWWAQLLFINNFVYADGRCLVQSWYFAVEMQLFVGTVAFALVLAARPRRALQILAALYVVAIGVNYTLNVAWNIQPIVKFATVEAVRTMLVGVDSYTWMYSVPWTSLPSTLHGLGLAFLTYNLEENGFKPDKHKWIGKMLKLMIVVMPSWMLTGHLMRHLEDPYWLAVYATFDRTIWNIMVTYCIFAFIHGYGGLVLRYLRWGGFQILSRMVYSIMLVHWHLNLWGPVTSPVAIDVTGYTLVSYYIVSVATSILLALPMHLLVELPMQKVLS